MIYILYNIYIYYIYTYIYIYIYIYTGCNRKKLDQNKITINFCFIIDIDILFMNSFLILMFFKEGVANKNVVLIISLVKIFTNGKNTEKQVVRM